MQAISTSQPLQPAQTRPKLSDLPTTLLLIRERTTSKLGQRAHGEITYQVLTDLSRKQLYVRVTANAGSGSFSNEPVPTSSLRQCLSMRDSAKPLRASALQPVIRGRSSCNCGFIAAALVSERILSRHPDKRHDLVEMGTWDSWTAEQLASDLELVEVKLKEDPVSDDDNLTDVTEVTEVTDAVDPNEAVEAAGQNTVASGRRKLKLRE